MPSGCWMMDDMLMRFPFFLALLAPMIMSACTLPDPCTKHSPGEMAYTSCRAHQGNISAQLALANAYFEGDGMEQDYKKAVRWYKRAAAYRSGTTYVYSAPVGGENHGRVLPVQTGTASAGSLEAKYQLSRIYREGIGVEKNEEKARKWLERAERQGVDPTYLSQQ